MHGMITAGRSALQRETSSLFMGEQLIYEQKYFKALITKAFVRTQHPMRFWAVSFPELTWTNTWTIKKLKTQCQNLSFGYKILIGVHPTLDRVALFAPLHKGLYLCLTL